MSPKPQPAFTWDEMDAIRAALHPERPPNSITAQEWATRYGVSVLRAGRELNRLVDAGKLTVSRVTIDKHFHNIYTPK